jgi:hypothetical protein
VLLENREHSPRIGQYRGRAQLRPCTFSSESAPDISIVNSMISLPFRLRFSNPRNYGVLRELLNAGGST